MSKPWLLKCKCLYTKYWTWRLNFRNKSLVFLLFCKPDPSHFLEMNTMSVNKRKLSWFLSLFISSTFATCKRHWKTVRHRCLLYLFSNRLSVPCQVHAFPAGLGLDSNFALWQHRNETPLQTSHGERGKREPLVTRLWCNLFQGSSLHSKESEMSFILITFKRITKL